jgi:hypothetical protein
VVVGAGGTGGISCNACGKKAGSMGGGASGAVRIVWPGSIRQFPSTCVGTP